MDKIKVVLIKVGSKPKIIEIENQLEEFQRLVGGYIECVPVQEYEDGRELVLVGDEEGKLKNKPINFPLVYNGALYDFMVGDVLACMSMDGEFVGSQQDVDDIMEYLENENLYLA